MALIFSELRENWPHLGQGWNHAKLGELSRESECLSRSKKPLRHSERNYPHCSSSCRHRICRRVTQSLGYCFKIHTHYRLSSASHRASPSPSLHSAPPSRPWHATSSADTHTETGRYTHAITVAVGAQAAGTHLHSHGREIRQAYHLRRRLRWQL